MSERTVSNWCKGKSLPTEIEPILRPLFGRTPEGSDHVYTRGKLRDAYIAARTEKLATVIAQAQPDPAGGEWFIQGEQFALDRTVRATDNHAAADPSRQRMQAAIRDFAAELIEPAKRLSNSRVWNALPRTITAFHALLECDPLQMPERLGEAYALLLRLGRFLETDTRLQKNPAHSDDPLDPEIHGLLVDVVRTAAPWMRGFPTVAALDDEAGRALVRADLFQPAREFTRIAHGQQAISERDAAEMELLADTAEAEDFQGQKAGTRAIGHAKNLLLAEAEVVATSLAQISEHQSPTQVVLVQRAIETLTIAASQVEAFSATLPPDLRQALRFLVEGGRQSAEMISADQLVEPLRAIPDDVEEQAKILILQGFAPPVDWRPFIREISFQGSNINNIELLSDLYALEKLNLWETGISDTSPLSKLYNLTELNLGNTTINNISALSTLNKIEILDLWNTSVTDISPLSGMTALRSLDLARTSISDAEPLSSLRVLEDLDLTGTQVNDLSPLAVLTNLEKLSLGNTEIDDLSPLLKLQKLKILNAWGNKIIDLSSISKLTNLIYLDLENSNLADLSVLSKLNNLMSLNIEGTQVRDLSPLSGMVDMRVLQLGSTKVSDLSPLADMMELKKLDLESTDVSDLSPLADMIELRDINLDGTKVSDLSPLADMMDLQVLDLASTDVSDLSPLAGMIDLKKLNLSSTNVSDVTPLASLTNLASLNLAGTQVSDVTPLAALTGLKQLDLTRTHVSDVFSLSHLEELKVEGP
ncbi:leucine-rich repeat domain-containing protein [Methylobacterium sp. 37f]|uniref:leucine-rich repeat domain-containing protein n=1 Tax=Methylobacterium sp. 37f TaxID=2817058 RepID=UPI001FFC5EB2|nr:leucine-rich repeat domain-containing protein [Methylobacterium sp. 37f]MCK2053800.1 hypothetical protein [Methylobacterium sp. 37f]